MKRLNLRNETDDDGLHSHEGQSRARKTKEDSLRERQDIEQSFNGKGGRLVPQTLRDLRARRPVEVVDRAEERGPKPIV